MGCTIAFVYGHGVVHALLVPGRSPRPGESSHGATGSLVVGVTAGVLTFTISDEGAEALVETIAERVIERLGERRQGSPWMTVAQAAAYLGWSKDRVYKLTAAGAIPHRKHGNRLLFRREELDAWLDGYREGPRGRLRRPGDGSRSLTSR